MTDAPTTPAPPPVHDATTLANAPAPLPGPVVGVGAQGSPRTRTEPGLPPPVRGYAAPRVPSGFAHAPPMAHPPSPPGPSFVGGALASLPQTAAVVTLDPKTRAPVVLRSHSVSPALPRMSSAADPIPRPPAPRAAALVGNPTPKALPLAPPVSPLAFPLMAHNNPARLRKPAVVPVVVEDPAKRAARLRAEFAVKHHAKKA
jgi:hypothetical protein